MATHATRCLARTLAISMDVIAGFAVIGVLALVLRQVVVAVVRRLRGRPNPDSPPPPAREQPGEHGREAAAARALAGLFAREERPITGLALLEEPRVAAIVRGLAQPSVPVSEPWNLARSRVNLFEIVFGLAALRDRSDTPQEVIDWAVGTALREVHTLVEPFVYALLLERAERPVIGRALAALAVGLDQDELASFIVARRASEEVSEATFAEHLPFDVVESVGDFVRVHESRLGADFRDLFETWRAAIVDTIFCAKSARSGRRPTTGPRRFSSVIAARSSARSARRWSTRRLARCCWSANTAWASPRFCGRHSTARRDRWSCSRPRRRKSTPARCTSGSSRAGRRNL